MLFRASNLSAVVFIALFFVKVVVRQTRAVHGRTHVRHGGALRPEEEAMEEEEEEIEDERDYDKDGERKIAAILSSADSDSRTREIPNLKTVNTEYSAVKDSSTIMSVSSEYSNETSRRPIKQNYNIHHQHHFDNNHGSHLSSEFNKESVFEQGETRDFLRFLQRIQYDHRQFPSNDENGDEPVLVSVSVVVSNVRAVSEVTMDYSLEMFYRESWLDKRLIYEKQKFKNKSELALHESYANFLWHPDTFMPNAIASKNPRKQSVSHRSLLRLQSDGNVLYSRRLSVVAECPMDLTLFPFDSQVCKLGIESYGYTADQVRYGWSHGKRKALTLQKIRLPDFRIKEAFVTNQVENYATGNYSRLYICFVFTRSAGFCFLQLIIPSTAVVITSWVSMWMENETSFQDMISIILTILLLTFSYNEALDIWLAVCFMVAFLSLIKLALCKYIRQRLQITQDTSIVADMIPLVRVAAANNIRIQREPSIYAGNRQNSYLSPPEPQRYRSSLTIKNQQANLGPQINSIKLAQNSSAPNSYALGQRQSSLTRNLSTNSNSAVVGINSKTRPSRATRQATVPQRVSRLATVLDNNNNNNESYEMRAEPSTARDYGRGDASYHPHDSNKLPACYNGAIETAIERLGGCLGQIIAHQALSKTSTSKSPLLDAATDTLSRMLLSRDVIRQMHKRRAKEQQELQTRIETQLIHAQAQLYLRQKDEERLRKKRRLHRNMKAALNAASASHSANPVDEYYDTSPTTALDGEPDLEAAAGEQLPGELNINFDGDVSVGGCTDVKSRLLHRLDRIGNIEFSAQFLKRFHWISQMTFFFCFVIFCFFFFLIYPNTRVPIMDPACIQEQAEWFAAL